MTAKTASCGVRLFNIFLRKRLPVSSRRDMTDHYSLLAALSSFVFPSVMKDERGKRPTVASSASPMERYSQLFEPTVNLPIMNGCIAPQVTLQRKRKEPGLSATKVSVAIWPGSAWTETPYPSMYKPCTTSVLTSWIVTLSPGATLSSEGE